MRRKINFEEDLSLLEKEDLNLFLFIGLDCLGCSLDTVNYLTQKLNKKGIYVSFTDESSRFDNAIKDKKINLRKVHLVFASGQKGKASNRDKTYCNRKCSLPEISLVLSELINSGKYDFVMLCPLDEMLIFNPKLVIKKFINYFGRILKNQGMAGIVFTRDNDSSSLLVPEIIDHCGSSVLIE